MQKGSSDRLVMIAREIYRICENYDVMINATITEGAGFSEYINHFNTSWSVINLSRDGEITVSAKKPEWESGKFQRSVNAICHFKNVTIYHANKFVELVNTLKTKIQIDESGKGIFSPGSLRD